jgi:hypothetical protein
LAQVQNLVNKAVSNFERNAARGAPIESLRIEHRPRLPSASSLREHGIPIVGPVAEGFLEVVMAIEAEAGRDA